MATGNKIVRSQFTVQSIARIPCDEVFLALLSQTATVKRPYDKNEGVKKVNDYGEVIMTYPTAPVVQTGLPTRIDPVRQRGELGYKIELQGGIVYATFRAFVCPDTDIVENDTMIVGSREFQVVLVDELFDSAKLHHLEVFLRRVDNL